MNYSEKNKKNSKINTEKTQTELQLQWQLKRKKEKKERKRSDAFYFTIIINFKNLIFI